MHLSIVSGTYNRIKSLKRMVESVRQSVKYPLNYEIVLVDGGSTDGTIDWCKSQGDVRLIEHGVLLGAVKAFNDGAYSSVGDYVILANDDIEFLDSSIYDAWVFMQSNPLVGIGCFYQNRGGRGWHVEKMPVIRNGQQAMEWYGQVCIVPKWLGDHCGWWGDYLHTYGGDNQLSSMVYETGYQIRPIEGAKIADHEVKDHLRKINNINSGADPRAVKGHHPDSYAWYRKWRNAINRDLVGPVVKDTPILENPITPLERIIYLPIYEQGWMVQKEQKRGLREALQKIGLVYEYDYVTRFAQSGENAEDTLKRELAELVTGFQPTVFLAQLHNDANIKGATIRRLKRLSPDTTFINWNGDYWPDNYYSDGGIALAKEFDLFTCVNLDVVSNYKLKGINAHYWQIGWESEGHIEDVGPECDIVFQGTGYSSKRQELVRFIKGLSYNTKIYGSGWPDGWSSGQTMYNFREAAKLYRGAKLAIGDSQWPDSGFVSNRIFQILVAGNCALCHQWFKGIENLGLIDGQNCIIWDDFNSLKTKIDYYLKEDSKRIAIAQAGQYLALSKHSFDHRVKELMELIRKPVITRKVQEFETWR